MQKMNKKTMKKRLFVMLAAAMLIFDSLSVPVMATSTTNQTTNDQTTNQTTNNDSDDGNKKPANNTTNSGNKGEMEDVEDVVQVTKPEDPYENTSTNDFIMVGGSWVTPIAVHGNYVNVVLPVVNMSVKNLTDVIITPVIAGKNEEWPFEIETSSYTQKIPDLPGKGNGQDDMERRRELTWTFKTREDVLNGYYALPFNVIYYSGEGYETATLTTWIRAVGAAGSGNVEDAGSGLSIPRVIVTGYHTVPEKVYAGDTFTLTLYLKNTSKRTAVSNMKIDLDAPSEGSDSNSAYEAFLPTSGSNTMYLEQISAGSTAELSIEMTAKSDLAQKPYQVKVDMDYEDSKYTSYSATANVSIPINQEAKFDIGTPEVLPADISVGDQSNVMFSIFNTGKTTLYNVQVKFEADSVSGGEAFLGKIESGGTGNVDAMLTGEAPTMDDGIVKAVVYYEDEAGKQYTKEQEFNLFVSEQMDMGMDMGMDMDMDMDMGQEGGKKGLKIVIILVVVLILIAGGVTTTVILVKNHKKKKEKMELEADLDEDEYDDEGSEDASGDEEV